MSWILIEVWTQTGNACEAVQPDDEMAVEHEAYLLFCHSQVTLETPNSATVTVNSIKTEHAPDEGVDGIVIH